MATNTIIRGTGFTYRFTLPYDDDDSPIDLDDCTDITIQLIRDTVDDELLFEGKLSLGTVTKITAALGIGEVYVDDTVTEGESRGSYKAVAIVKVANENFTGGFVSYGGELADSFILD